MRILLAHNFYQQPGGEDRVFATEADLLEAHGHEVTRFTIHNDRVSIMSGGQLLAATIWNREMYARLRHTVRDRGIELVHFHNTFPLISPAGYAAARHGGAVVVQTLHNFRLVCLNATLFRKGKTCEKCLGRSLPWPGLSRSCYRDDRGASAVAASSMIIHRAARTWHRLIDAFIVPSDFARGKLIAGGLPEQKLLVKPNCVYPDPAPGAGTGRYMVFVGRLSPEKGVETLLEAWPKLGGAVKLKIVGDGPLAERVVRAAGLAGGDGRPTLSLLGHLPPERVQTLVAGASALIFPSRCYETFGRSIIEAFAAGTPVIASNLGASAELVAHGRNGLLFAPGDAEDLACQVRGLLADEGKLAQMRSNARADYESRYTGQRNYEHLMDIYRQAIARRKSA